ncbi:inositol monophosphatase family protein [Ornithinimicrobium panacihumi]|uniref:inositol monophosphatase family protein n=1 Tax=Ornithinimicrobium panacihumi TaxID=2008449 RepID=UPI003F8C2FCC
MALDTDAVLTLLQETGEAVINPRFRALADDDISSKTHPGDLVTIADQEAEVIITRALRAAYPQALVLGEEAYAVQPHLLEDYRTAEHVWTVDPVDGTRNFVHGSPDHAVMASEAIGGETVRAWIWQPQHGVAYVAERGAGLWRDDTRGGRTRVTRTAPGPDPVTWRARTSHRAEIGTMTGPVGPWGLTWISCGIDYPKLAEGACDVLRYVGTMPWDHVPGALMVHEAGGFVGDERGEAYGPRATPGRIVAAGSEAAYRDVLAFT